MESSTIDDPVSANAAERPADLALAVAPNRAAFFAGDPKRLTWSELDAAVSSAAASLRDLGAGPDGPVGIQLPNAAYAHM